MAGAVAVAGEIKEMLKKLAIYTLFLIGVDFFVNLVVNFIQHNPGSVIITSVILRAVCILVFFPLVGIVISALVKVKGNNALLIMTTLTVYILFPVVIYFLTSNNKSLQEVYVDLHVQFDLFVVVFLPYLIASVICILIVNKLRLF
jgi:hypothetical protein